MPNPPDPSTPYLSHVNDAHSKGLVAQDCAVLVPLPPLQHDLQFIAISLEKVWVLGRGIIGRQQHDSRAQHSTRVENSSPVLIYSRIWPAERPLHHPPNPHCPAKQSPKHWSSWPAASTCAVMIQALLRGCPLHSQPLKQSLQRNAV